MPYQTMLRIVALGYTTFITGCAVSLDVPEEVACPGSQVAVETQALLIRSELTMTPAPSVASEQSQLGLVRFGKTDRQITVQEDTTFTLTPVRGRVQTESVRVVTENETRDLAFEVTNPCTGGRDPDNPIRFVRYTGAHTVPWSNDVVIQSVTNTTDRLVTLNYLSGPDVTLEAGETSNALNGLPANAGWLIFLEDRRQNEGCGDPPRPPFGPGGPVLQVPTDPPPLTVSIEYGCATN